MEATLREQECSTETNPQSILPSRVLLVEDDHANRLVASAMLEILGYPFDIAKNGEEAVEKAKAGFYAIVLMDMQMDDMNGLEATRQIRAFEQEHARPALHIIGITANAFAEDRSSCLAAGMNDYLSKPYPFDKFKEKLAVHQEG